MGVEEREQFACRKERPPVEDDGQRVKSFQVQGIGINRRPECAERHCKSKAKIWARSDRLSGEGQVC
jgi:hypothetical protein